MIANFTHIPLFDLQDFDTKKNIFIDQLRDVCHHVGFFYIKNHGVSSGLIKRIMQATDAFFNLPQEEKDAISIKLSPHYRGYGRLGAETTEGKSDYKETYDLGIEQPAQEFLQQSYEILQGSNQWPTSSLFPWKETILEYIAAMQQLGKRLMTAISLTLDLPEDYFVKRFCANSADSYAMLRLLRYPSGRIHGENAEPQLGVGPHIDSGCLVLLLQDEIGGLQVQNCKEQWIDAPPIPGTFVVNIGKMLQIWSNNYFLATPHRVINASSKIRHSVPFFFEPDLTTEVSPLTISPRLLAQMTREPADPSTKVVYGEYMLEVFRRSFP